MREAHAATSREAHAATPQRTREHRRPAARAWRMHVASPTDRPRCTHRARQISPSPAFTWASATSSPHCTYAALPTRVALHHALDSQRTLLLPTRVVCARLAHVARRSQRRAVRRPLADGDQAQRASARRHRPRRSRLHPAGASSALQRPLSAPTPAAHTFASHLCALAPMHSFAPIVEPIATGPRQPVWQRVGLRHAPLAATHDRGRHCWYRRDDALRSERRPRAS